MSKGNPMGGFRLTPAIIKGLALLAQQKHCTMTDLVRPEIIALLERNGIDSSTGEARKEGGDSVCEA